MCYNIFNEYKGLIMNKIKIYITVFLVIFISFVSFYGNRGAEDQFVFGKSRVYCNGSVITIKTPFELAVNGKQSDLSQNNVYNVIAAGADKNFQILVFGYKVDEHTSPKIIIDEQIDLLKTDENISNLKLGTGKSSINGREAYVLDSTFNEELKKGNEDLVIKVYTFQDNQTVWKVIYQYKANDEIGKAIMEKLDKKIISGVVL